MNKYVPPGVIIYYFVRSDYTQSHKFEITSQHTIAHFNLYMVTQRLMINVYRVAGNDAEIQEPRGDIPERNYEYLYRWLLSWYYLSIVRIVKRSLTLL